MALSDYTQLEYIYNNDGWAYIDTGYTMEKTDSITFEQICYISDITWSGVNGYCQWSSEILTLNTRCTVKVEYDGSTFTQKIYVNGVLNTTNNWSDYNATNSKIGVLRMGSDNNSWWSTQQQQPSGGYVQAGRLYSYKMYKNNTLVLDLIPVKRRSDNVVGMYNKVDNKFLSSAGSDPFYAGPVIFDGSQLQQNILEIQDLMIQCNDLSLDILGGTPKPDPLKDYKKLEYIQSTGSQYINTDINIGATTDIEVKFITVQAADGYGRVWGSTSDMRYELADTGGNTGYRISINGTGYDFSTTNDIKIVKMTGNGTVFLNNSQIHNFNKSYTGGEKLWLFWGNSGDWKNVYGRIKLYYAKVWQDNKLVRNYMPVLRKEDNKVGLFDIQNNQFYIDVNNGNFTAGPEIN